MGPIGAPNLGKRANDLGECANRLPRWLDNGPRCRPEWVGAEGEKGRMTDTVLTQKASRVREMVDDLRMQGYAVDRMLDAAGIRESELAAQDAVLPFEKVALIWEEAAQLTGDDLIGFSEAGRLRVLGSGAIAYTGLASPTVRDLMLNLARYRRVYCDALEIDVSRLSDQGIVAWSYAVPARVSSRQLVEFNATNIVAAIRSSTGREVRPLSVVFGHPRPDAPPEMARFFGCDLRFGAGANHLRLRLADIDLPLQTADNELYLILKQHCERILSERATAPLSIVAEVEREVTARLSRGEARLDPVAQALGMSRRTLARRLSAEGTSFSGVIEGLRKALAEQYLRHSEMPVTEIAFLLGYNDAASFSTAFRRWNGTGPRAFRATA
jgi:AraC-like DNA-binding protein